MVLIVSKAAFQKIQSISAKMTISSSNMTSQKMQEDEVPWEIDGDEICCISDVLSNGVGV